MAQPISLVRQPVCLENMAGVTSRLHSISRPHSISPRTSGCALPEDSGTLSPQFPDLRVPLAQVSPSEPKHQQPLAHSRAGNDPDLGTFFKAADAKGMLRTVAVASPQGRVNIDIETSSYHSFRLGPSPSPSLSPEPSVTVLEEERRELARLRVENAELRSAKRQSDAMQNHHLEAAAASERDRAMKLEQKLQEEAEERRRAATEVQELRIELQRARRSSEAQLLEVQEKVHEYEKQLSEKEEQLKRSEEMLLLARSSGTQAKSECTPAPASATFSNPPATTPVLAGPSRHMAGPLRRSSLDHSGEARSCTAPGSVQDTQVAPPVVESASRRSSISLNGGTPAFLGSSGRLVTSAAADRSCGTPPRTDKPRRGIVAENLARFERGDTPVRGSCELNTLVRQARDSQASDSASVCFAAATERNALLSKARVSTSVCITAATERNSLRAAAEWRASVLGTVVASKEDESVLSDTKCAESVLSEITVSDIKCTHESLLADEAEECVFGLSPMPRSKP